MSLWSSPWIVSIPNPVRNTLLVQRFHWGRESSVKLKFSCEVNIQCGGGVVGCGLAGRGHAKPNKTMARERWWATQRHFCGGLKRRRRSAANRDDVHAGRPEGMQLIHMLGYSWGGGRVHFHCACLAFRGKPHWIYQKCIQMLCIIPQSHTHVVLYYWSSYTGKYRHPTSYLWCFCNCH